MKNFKVTIFALTLLILIRAEDISSFGDDYKEIFRKFDKDGDQRLNKDELGRAITKIVNLIFANNQVNYLHYDYQSIMMTKT
jgi:Ca2+-binding EF-hand superfamily protein